MGKILQIFTFAARFKALELAFSFWGLQLRTEVIYPKSRKHVVTVSAEFRGGFTASLKYFGGLNVFGTPIRLLP